MRVKTDFYVEKVKKIIIFDLKPKKKLHYPNRFTQNKKW